MPRLISIILLFCFLFTTNALPVSAAISYTYDQNGNMTSDGTKCFEYNEANQMYRVKTCSSNQTIAEYIYDYSGKRLVKKEYENGVLKQTVYSPTDEYETKKIEGGATQNTVYYKANTEIVAKKNPDGSINYYHNDHLGSTTVLTDQSGAVVEKSAYEPYGEIKQGGTKSKFGYTGQEKDNETGLSYYDARYYDPHLQRFIQPDTLLPDIFDPQQLNRYSYARNNPLKYTDPTGHEALTLTSIFLLGLLFGGSYIATTQPKTFANAISATWNLINYYSNEAKKVISNTTTPSTPAKTSTTQTSRSSSQTSTSKTSNINNQKPQDLKKNDTPSNQKQQLDRNPKQDQKLNKGEIEKLKRAGYDIEELKDNRSDLDLFKVPKTGEIKIKPKSGKGKGEDTGININEL